MAIRSNGPPPPAARPSVASPQRPVSKTARSVGDAKAGGSARAGKSKGGTAEGVKLQKGAFGDGIEKTDRDRQKTTTGTFSAVTDKPQGLDAAAKKATKPTGDLRRAAHEGGKVGTAPKSDGSATNKANALARASLKQAAAAALKAGGDKKPDAGALKADGAKKPDAGALKPDGATKPDAGALKPDRAKRPDAAALKPDGATKPDAGALKPDGAKKPDAGALKPDGAKKPEGAPTPQSPKPAAAPAIKAPASVDKPVLQSSAPKLAAPSSSGSDGKSASAPVKAEAGKAEAGKAASSASAGAGKAAVSASGAQGPKLEGAQAKREVEGGLVSDRPQGAKSNAQPAPSERPASGDKPAATTPTQGSPAKGEGTPATTAAQGTQGGTTKESDGQGATKSSTVGKPTQLQGTSSSSSSPLQRSANAPQPLTADAKLAALTRDVPKAEVAEIAQGVVEGLDSQLNTAVVAQRESDIADALSTNTEVAHASRRLADADFFADTAAHIRETAEDIDGVLLDDDGRSSAAANGLPFVKGDDHSGINLPVITADMKLMASVLANQRMDASDITSGLDDISGSDSEGGGEGGGGDEGGGEE